MIRKLRRRFILIAMASVFTVLAVIMGTVNVMNYRKILTDTDHVMQILVENDGVFPKVTPPDVKENESQGAGDISDTDEKAEGKESPDNIQPPEAGKQKEQSLTAETPYETRYFTVWMDEDGTVTDTNTENIAALDSEAVEEIAETVYAKSQEKGVIGNYRYQKVEEDGETMLIFIDCQKSLATFRNFLLSSMGMSAAGFAAVCILIILLSKQVFRPVEESYRKQKQFITDASHELKTPLTIIDANVEVMEMENGESQWTKSIHNQTKRLANLTAELVTLSRLDEQKEMQMIDFSLSDAVNETVQNFRIPIESAGKKLTCEVEKNLTLKGEEQQIRKVLSILMDNARKYSCEKGEIWVRVFQHGKWKHILVENQTENQKQGDLKEVFERFYRADASRSSEIPGYGIGLSTAQAIVQAHKGKISARGEGERFRIEIMLP